jgi:ribosomal protein S27AE
MIVKSREDISVALKICELIDLGASNRDVCEIFPDFFEGKTGNSAESKAQRVYAMLKDTNGFNRPKAGKVATIASVLSKKNLLTPALSFTRITISYLKSGQVDYSDFYQSFVKIFKAYKHNSSQDSLNFQQARALFKHYAVMNKLELSRVIKTCPKCGASVFSKAFIDDVIFNNKSAYRCHKCSQKF